MMMILFMLATNLQDSLTHDNDVLSWSPLYAAKHATPIQSIPWPCVLFNLIVSTSTRYHYTCRFNNVVEAREDVRCLLESFIFSGGLCESVNDDNDDDNNDDNNDDGQ